MRKISNRIILTFTLCWSLWASAALADKPNQASTSLSPALNLASVSILRSDGKQEGSGVLVAKPVPWLLTSRHVTDSLCSKSLFFQIRFDGIQPSPSLVMIDCSEVIPQKSTGKRHADLAVIRPKALSQEILAILTKAPLQIGKVPSVGRRTVRGEVLCRSGLRPGGETSEIFDNGGYLVNQSESLPGCSGSGLIYQGELIGILKGFHLATRQTLYVPLTREVLEDSGLKLDARNDRVIDASKGDPINGGDSVTPEFVTVYPDLGELPTFSAAHRILHVPERSEKGWIPTQMDASYSSGWGEKAFTCRGDLTPFDSRAKTQIARSGQAASWPEWLSKVLPELDRDSVEIQAKLILKRDPVTGTVSGDLYPKARGNPYFSRTIERDQKTGVTRIFVDNQSWSVTLGEGWIEIRDPWVQDETSSPVRLFDPNPCYRGIQLQHAQNGKIAVYNIENHASMNSFGKQRLFEWQIRRVIADSEDDLRTGKSRSLEIIHSSVRNAGGKQ